MQRNLRTFYTILSTQAISQIGSQMTGIAIGIWLFQQTGDVTPLALVSFFAMIPPVLFANFAGLAADRFDRRKIMALADTGAAAGSLILMALFFSGSFEVWHLYVIVLVQELCRAFQHPAYTASVTMLVPDEQRDRANGIMQLTGPLGGIIAPALAAALYAFGGVTLVLGIDLLSFGVAITAMILARIPRPPQTAEGAARKSIFSDLTVGFGFLWKHKPMLIMMGFVTFINFVMVGMGTLQTPYILSRTGNSEATLGVLLSAANFGALAGGIIISVWGGTRPRIHTAMIGIIAFGVFAITFGLAQTPVAMGAALFLTMAAPMFANVPFMSILQAKVPPDMQGRVFATVTQVALLFSPLSALVVGPLADNVFEPAVGTASWAALAPLFGTGPGAGLGVMIAIAGVSTAAAAAVCYALPMMRRMEQTIPDWNAAQEPEAAPVVPAAVEVAPASI